MNVLTYRHPHNKGIYLIIFYRCKLFHVIQSLCPRKLRRWVIPDHNDDEVAGAFVSLVVVVVGVDFGAVSAGDFDVVIVEIAGVEIAVFSNFAIYK